MRILYDMFNVFTILLLFVIYIMGNPRFWTCFVNGNNEDLPLDELFNQPKVFPSPVVASTPYAKNNNETRTNYSC
jgi:hypothetical protein